MGSDTIRGRDRAAARPRRPWPGSPAREQLYGHAELAFGGGVLVSLGGPSVSQAQPLRCPDLEIVPVVHHQSERTVVDRVRPDDVNETPAGVALGIMLVSSLRVVAGIAGRLRSVIALEGSTT